MIVSYKNQKPKIDYGKSLTVPDQNYTVKELFERFARGLPVQASRQTPIFLGEENDVDMEKLKNMSVMDKADLSDELLDQARGLNQRYNDLRNQRSEETKEEGADKKQPESKAPEAPKA